MIIFRQSCSYLCMLFSAVLLYVFSTVVFSNVSHAKDGPIGVAWPEVREPYNQIFIALRDGVAANSEQKLEQYLLVDDTQTENVTKWLGDKNINGLVLLGNRGLNLAQQLTTTTDLPIVVGGTFIDGNAKNKNIVGISMAPDPLYLFKKLLDIFPKANTINVVYEPEEAWLIEHAQKAAVQLNIKLNALVADDIRELAASYQNILRTQKRKTEALWLPYSGKSLEKALLNEVLEMAWNRDLIVFSSNLADVSKGILFSLYPDNDLTGIRLAELLRKQNQVKAEREYGVYLSQDLFAALNTRTAEHLGIRLGTDEKNEYKILFPLKR